MKLDDMKLFKNLFGNTRTSESGAEQELKDNNNLFVNPELFLDQNHPEKILLKLIPQIQKFVEKILSLKDISKVSTWYVKIS